MLASLSPLLDLAEVRRVTTLPRSSIYEALGRGDFPVPVRIGTRRIAWRSDDVQNWIDSRPLAVNATKREAA